MPPQSISLALSPHRSSPFPRWHAGLSLETDTISITTNDLHASTRRRRRRPPVCPPFPPAWPALWPTVGTALTPSVGLRRHDRAATSSRRGSSPPHRSRRSLDECSSLYDVYSLARCRLLSSALQETLQCFQSVNKFLPRRTV